MSPLARARRLFGAVFLIVGVVVVFGIAVITVTDRAAAASLMQTVASSISCSVTGTSSCFSATDTSSGIGVYGTSKSGTGLRGLSTSNNGVKGTSTSGIGVNGQSGSNDGVYAQSSSGNGIEAVSQSIAGKFTGSGGTFTEGVYAYGNDVGIDSYASAEDDHFPFFGTGIDASGTKHNVFYVDGVGDLYYSGMMNSTALMQGGSSATAFGTKATAPTLEDTGTARLVAGVAAVRIDPTFAATIDTSTPYRVFLTPAGDSRGLYVASRNMAGFVVRESQGGHSSMSFDYRIVASPMGHARERMARITRLPQR